jgi:hypothetical protein
MAHVRLNEDQASSITRLGQVGDVKVAAGTNHTYEAYGTPDALVRWLVTVQGFTTSAARALVQAS